MIGHQKYFLLLLLLLAVPAGSNELKATGPDVIPGAYRTEMYVSALQGKKVAVAGNHTSIINRTHLVDTLMSLGIEVVKAFSPEHGFRGEAAHGEWVDSETDAKTGIPIISLYGSNRRPTPEQLADVDIIVFDIQDVGVRFYTYLSTMTYIMQAAARESIPVMILDRPNPLGHYVDGPILELAHASFVGLHPVPVVHGMTPAEYAQMVNGERWLGMNETCELIIIPVKNYTHSSHYLLPVPPSPNLPNMHSVYLYPSLCFFEGTDISLGRGTDKPFQVFGHPELPEPLFPYTFTPQSVRAAPNPPQLNQTCNGRDLSVLSLEELQQMSQINLEYLIVAYRHFPNKPGFFNNFFERLAGNALLRHQITVGYTAAQIRASWQEDLVKFKKMRSAYLIYPDFD